VHTSAASVTILSPGEWKARLSGSLAERVARSGYSFAGLDVL
jgi:hypothetical protein